MMDDKESIYVRHKCKCSSLEFCVKKGARSCIVVCPPISALDFFIYANDSFNTQKGDFHGDLPNILGLSFCNVTTPNFDLFLKPHTLHSCLKCTPTTHESLWLVLETPTFGTLRESRIPFWLPTRPHKVFQYDIGNHVELFIYAILGVVTLESLESMFSNGDTCITLTFWKPLH